MKGVYGQDRVDDLVRLMRAGVTNQVARFMPAAYVRMTGETGRGREAASPRDTARYFVECVLDYCDVRGVSRSELANCWRGLSILEYGPGDIPGVALLLAGLGARAVLCVDRFPLVRFDEYQQSVVRELASLLPDDDARTRFWSCFRQPGDPASGLAEGAVRYSIAPSGLASRHGIADMVLSRAVLEHVDDLPATFADMAAALVDGGLALHKVDLKSHGLHRVNRLDFLSWPEPLWRLMFSHKGAPNRLRLDSYRRAVQGSGLRTVCLQPCESATVEEVRAIRPHLALPFQDIEDDDLAVLSFWMILEKPGLPASKGGQS